MSSLLRAAASLPAVVLNHGFARDKRTHPKNDETELVASDVVTAFAAP